MKYFFNWILYFLNNVPNWIVFSIFLQTQDIKRENYLVLVSFPGLRKYLCMVNEFCFQKLRNKYRKVASSNTSHLEAHAGFFRLLMKGIYSISVSSSHLYLVGGGCSTWITTKYTRWMAAEWYYSQWLDFLSRGTRKFNVENQLTYTGSSLFGAWKNLH